MMLINKTTNFFNKLTRGIKTFSALKTHFPGKRKNNDNIKTFGSYSGEEDSSSVALATIKT